MTMKIQTGSNNIALSDQEIESLVHFYKINLILFLDLAQKKRRFRAIFYC